jgi:AcrR family transcriptional regulator
MVTQVDRRVRRTRVALRDALLDLMVERDYETVTVQDITQRADVGRSTFYNHFTDKDALLRESLADLRTIVTRAGTGRPLAFSLPLLRHVHEQQRLARALLGGGRTAVWRRVEEALVELVRGELGAAGHVPVEATARYVVGAHLALMEWWLASRPDLAPEEVDRIVHTLVAPGLAQARSGS